MEKSAIVQEYWLCECFLRIFVCVFVFEQCDYRVAGVGRFYILGFFEKVLTSGMLIPTLWPLIAVDVRKQ